MLYSKNKIVEISKIFGKPAKAHFARIFIVMGVSLLLCPGLRSQVSPLILAYEFGNLIDSTQTPTKESVFHPYVGIKTNLLYWAGISPEFKYRGCMPNMALEAFLGKRYSVHIEGVYTSIDKKNADKEVWAVSGIAIEPRFWLHVDSAFTGFYTGFYSQYGEFDVKQNDLSATKGYSGTFFETGISLGYYYPISRTLGLDMGLCVGYRQANADEYFSWDTDHYYRQQTKTGSMFGLHQVRLSVVYRFAKENH